MKYVILLLTMVSTSFAVGPVKFGFGVGASVPNDQIGNIFNNSQQILDKLDNSVADVLLNSEGVGYNIGIKLRVDLPGNFIFSGGFAFHKFADQNIRLTVTEAEKTTIDTSVTVIPNLIPINAGLLYNVIDSQVIDIYLRAEGQFNILSYSISQTAADLVNISDTTNGRLGTGFGVGIDISLVLVRLNLDARYNLVNLGLRNENEDLKSFFSLTGSIFF